MHLKSCAEGLGNRRCSSYRINAIASASGHSTAQLFQALFLDKFYQDRSANRG